MNNRSVLAEDWRSRKEKSMRFTLHWKQSVIAAAACLTLLAGGMSILASNALAAPAPAMATATPSGTIVMLPPQRIADSRISMSFGTLGAEQTADLQIVARGGVPLTGVSGAILNVTAIGGQQGGYLTVWNGEQSMPGTSNVNFAAGQIAANTVIVSLPQPDGSISLFNGAPGYTDVLVDVEGYIVG